MPPKFILAILFAWPVIAGSVSPSLNGSYIATAYSVAGTTAASGSTHRHVVAADPGVLPLGSRIKIRYAGRYSGEYVVADTGAKVIGRHLDIYMPSQRECIKFGSKRVRVRVVQVGDGTRATTQQADQTVKHEVATDISKGVVGNAATETDWAQKGAAKTKAVQAGTATAPPK